MRDATALASQGQFARAAAILLAIPQDGQSWSAAQAALGHVLRDAGYYLLDPVFLEKGIEAFEAAAEADPRNTDAALSRGVLLYDVGRFAEATTSLEPLETAGEVKVARVAKRYANAAQWSELLRKARDAPRDSKAELRLCRLCWSPIQGSYWQLEDKRVLCERCFSAGIHDEEALSKLWARGLEHIEQGLGLRLAKAPRSHLVAAAELVRLAGPDFKPLDGTVEQNLAGLFTRHEGQPAIYILRGLPGFEALAVLAHEYAHAWVSENCPLRTALGTNEGFAKWVAYQVLLRMEETEHAERMFLDRSSYGIHFKRMETAGRIRGAEGLIAMMREGRL